LEFFDFFLISPNSGVFVSNNRWAEQGYISTSLPDVEDVDESDDEFKPLETMEEDGVVDLQFNVPNIPSASTSNSQAPTAAPTVHFVQGNVCEPQTSNDLEPAIIMHCVDSSGEWTRGGLFGAITAKTDSVAQRYSEAKQMGDLKIGDAHVCEWVDENLREVNFVLCVVMKSDRTIDINALKTVFRKVSFIFPFFFPTHNKCPFAHFSFFPIFQFRCLCVVHSNLFV
jgi:hypothetical protein